MNVEACYEPFGLDDICPTEKFIHKLITKLKHVLSEFGNELIFAIFSVFYWFILLLLLFLFVVSTQILILLNLNLLLFAVLLRKAPSLLLSFILGWWKFLLLIIGLFALCLKSADRSIFRLSWHVFWLAIALTIHFSEGGLLLFIEAEGFIHFRASVLFIFIVGKTKHFILFS